MYCHKHIKCELYLNEFQNAKNLNLDKVWKYVDENYNEARHLCTLKTKSAKSSLMPDSVGDIL